MYNIEGFDFLKYLDGLSDIIKSIEPDKLTILVGPNGYGKSLIRKVLPREPKLGKIASTSMERRTQPNHDYDAFSSLAIDDPETATSNASFNLIDTMMTSSGDRYYILDEPEIGMGKEAQLGLANWINSIVAKLKEDGKWMGLLLITHSDFLIQNINFDTFIDLGGHTSFEAWKNREIKAINPADLDTWCVTMWRAIEKRINDNKK